MTEVVCPASLNELMCSEEEMRPRECCKVTHKYQLSSIYTPCKYHMSSHGSFLTKTPYEPVLASVCLSLTSFCQYARVWGSIKKSPEYGPKLFLCVPLWPYDKWCPLRNGKTYQNHPALLPVCWVTLNFMDPFTCFLYQNIFSHEYPSQTSFSLSDFPNGPQVSTSYAPLFKNFPFL